jgi:hypothetical protein
MASRFLPIAIVSALSGCAAHGNYVLKNPFQPKCGDQIAQSRRICMTSAEYYTARKQVQHSQDKTTVAENSESNPRFKDWIP